MKTIEEIFELVDGKRITYALIERIIIEDIDDYRRTNPKSVIVNETKFKGCVSIDTLIHTINSLKAEFGDHLNFEIEHDKFVVYGWEDVPEPHDEVVTRIKDALQRYKMFKAYEQNTQRELKLLSSFPSKRDFILAELKD